MSAGSLRVATYMQEHPDDAAEIRDELKFWNEVMDHQVPMIKERAEATLPFLTALEWGPLFTNTSPIMFCPPGLDPLDHPSQTHRFTNRNNDDMTAHAAIQPKAHLFPIRHWLPSPTDTVWTPRPNMTSPKPSKTPTDVHTDYRKPLCPPAAHLTDSPYNRFIGLNTTDMTAYAAIQPKPHLFPIRHWLPSRNDMAWTPRPNMTSPKPLPTPTDVKTKYSKPL
ncbi:hypothetical protein H257_13464 [Aphanomyces astaci]|uniref:Uncharacterized protein n=1 Tax=Aphanomyces astaci TaxID=112090 RepID=W4FV24_APHAT|nr:hypothetical protein H257_13464 [Aphanomyces astaci]ETV71342.1 hypothetical protein H257_13464 [Aphanomyces astaci]|eukprot:XP_009839282.1 hypothetical protein H257_13464 [Aphanomyces astaci]